MPDQSELHGNFDHCPACRKVVTNLNKHYDEFEALRGDTCLHLVNEFSCPHCKAEIALVTEMTHSLRRWKDVE